MSNTLSPTFADLIMETLLNTAMTRIMFPIPVSNLVRQYFNNITREHSLDFYFVV